MTILGLGQARDGGGKAGRHPLILVLSCATCCFMLCMVVRKAVVILYRNCPIVRHTASTESDIECSLRDQQPRPHRGIGIREAMYGYVYDRRQ